MFSALTGVFVNVITIIAGTVLGLIAKKGIPEKLKNAISIAVGLCVLYIGISGSLKTIIEDGQIFEANALVMIFALVIGTIIGTLLDLDGKLNFLGKSIENKFTKGSSDGSIAKGFVSATLIFCIGAMAITGPIESALTGNHSTLYAKSVLDGITSIILAVNFGWGVLLCTVPLFLYQGGIAAVAYIAGSSFLSADMNVQTIAVGSLIIVAIGLNMLNITKIKTADMLPSIFLAPLFSILFNLF